MRRAKFAAEPLELNAQLYPYSCRPLEKGRGKAAGWIVEVVSSKDVG